MNELLNKLSSYNLFNYLLPGIIFAVIATKTTHLNLLQTDIISGLALYYLLGLLLSTIGSIIIKPTLEVFKFIVREPYDKYIEASANDKKIEILAETSNTSRTFATMFVVLFILVALDDSLSGFYISEHQPYLLVFLVLAILLFLSHRKTSNYISSRVKNYKSPINNS